MLRFVPDSWSDGLLRPFLLPDPVAGLYTEIQAPDWRFLVLALALVAGLLHWRSRSMMEPSQWRMLLGLIVCFYVWTWVSGNGRYFLWGFLLVGPLVVLAMRHMPGSQALRNTLVVGVLAWQGFTVAMTFEPNVWGVRSWNQGPGLALEPHPVRQQAAVFLTIGSISYSIAVPFMHPASRWANIAGQQDLVPGMAEHARMHAMLDGPLPVKLMVNVTNRLLQPDGQPLPETRDVLAQFLRPHGLELDSGPCDLVRTRTAAPEPAAQPRIGRAHDLLFCGVRRQREPAPSPAFVPVAPELDDVFANVERRCPRFFPAGSAHTQSRDGTFVRRYSHSDTTLLIAGSEGVFYKYFRALNHTRIGSIQDVRDGRYTLDCTRVDGRYVPPWARE
jgi:hypothetical protein